MTKNNVFSKKEMTIEFCHIQGYISIIRLTLMQWRIQGARGSAPPPFGPRCRLFNIGPKVGPPPFLLVDLRWTPVADPGCVCVCDRGDHPHPLECG